MLSYGDVKEIFDYDSVSGDILWKKTRYKSRIGKLAGNLNKGGYRELSVTAPGTNKKQRMYAHRVAWLLTHGKWPEKHIDHINGNKTDNRLVNLREVTNQENHKNMKRHAGNKSGSTGVYWSKATSKWQAYICIDGKQTYLGVYADLEEAIKAREDAEIMAKYHKNHGRTGT